MRLRNWFFSALAFILVQLLPSIVLAQVSGPISSDTTWTAGTVVVSGTVTIPNGRTLTINPGTRVQFSTGTSLVVAGKLLANGKSDSLIFFTSNAGSPAPGDWNGIEFQNTANVASVFNYCVVEYAGSGPNAAGVFYKTGAFSIPISNCTFRLNANQALNTRASSPTITKSVFDRNNGYGIYSDLLSNFIVDSCTITNNTTGGIRIPVNATPSITHCTIDTNGTGIFVDNSAIPSIQNNNIRRNSTGIRWTGVGASQPVIMNNTISGNTVWGFQNTNLSTTVKAEQNYWGHDSGPFHPSLNPTGLGDNVSNLVDFQPWSVAAAARPVRQITADITTNRTWYADTVYWVKNSISVNGGITLTVRPGTIVKFATNARLTVNGTIVANGKSDSLIVFTSERDDPYGGDTNGDGATTGATPGIWDMIFMLGGGNNSSVLNYCLIRFGGSSSNGNLRVHSAIPIVTNVTCTQSSNYGIYFTTGADVLLSGCWIGANGLDGVLMQGAAPNFYNVRVVDNGRYGIYANSGSPHFTVRRSTFTGNSYGIVADASTQGATLVSMDSSDVSNNINGGLYLWYGTGPQTFSYNRISGNGAYGLWCFNINDLVTIQGDTILNNGHEGIVTSKAVITNNVIQGNRYPVAFTGRVGTTLSGNTISGNVYNNVLALRINSSTESFSDTLSAATPPGFAPATYVLIDNAANLGVSAGETLVIQPGVTIKLNAATLFRVDGTLIANGTGLNPIVFTSYRDASYGGKTNLSSDNTPPAPGDWRYVRIRPSAGAGASVLNNCIFNYGGTDGQGNLWIEGSSGVLTNQVSNIISRKSSSMGIRVTNVQLSFNSATVDSNGTFGIYIEGSSPRADVTVRNSTIQDNGSTGLAAVNNSTYREVSNCVIRRNNGHGVTVDNGTVSMVYFGNSVTNNNGHGIFVVSPSIALTDLQFIGNLVTDNLYEGIFSTAARFIDNTIQRNRYPIGVLGRLGNSYVDNQSVDGNIITNNTFNNAIALAGASYAPLQDTLKKVFPQAITSNTYVVIENIQVDAPTTLVIQPGVNVKFDATSGAYRSFNIYGTLRAEGTPAEPIIFTSWRDSTVGGKTIAIGDFGVPAPGDWYYVAFRAGSQNSVVRNCQFKYGGRDGAEAVYFAAGLGSLTFSNNIVRKSMGAGIIVDNTALIIDSTTVDSCNTFGIRVYDRVSANASLRNSRIVYNGSYGVYGEGTNGKFSVISNSTISNNAASGILISNNLVPLSIIGNTINSNAYHGIYVLARNDAVDTLLVIAGNKVRNNGLVGIYSSRAHVVDDSITGNRYAVGVFGQLSLNGTSNAAGNVYQGNVISGNTYNDVLVTEETTFGVLGLSFPQGYAAKVVAVRGSFNVPSGSTLTIAPGTVIKFPKEYNGGAGGATARFRVDGVLKSEGTLNNKIVFTSWMDDSYGGDSNGDANGSVPGPGDWDMIYLVGASNNSSHLLHTIVRYGGSGTVGNVRLDNNSAPIDSSFVSYSSNYGIYTLNASPSIYANEIHHNVTGVYASGSSNPVVQRNNIHENSTHGLNNATSNTINATNNYWGQPSGPFVNQGSDQNLSGTGDRIGINPGAVTYRPFLTTRSGILLGDVSENGTISAFDGALVLRAVVGLDTLRPSQALAADVSGEGGVSAYDASLILRYVVGLITGFPGLGKVDGGASLVSSYQFMLESGQAADEVELVLSLNGTASIFASEIHLTFDPAELTAVAMKTTSLSAAMSAVSNFGSGTAHVALAGTAAVTSAGDFVRIVFKTSRQFRDLSETSIRFDGFRLNETELLTSKENAAELPSTFGIGQNYPNPFNPTTTIQFQLPTASRVTIAIYDLLGREVRQLLDGEREPGYYSVMWDGTGSLGSPVASGVYFYRIHAKYGNKDFTVVKRMLLLK